MHACVCVWDKVRRSTPTHTQTPASQPASSGPSAATHAVSGVHVGALIQQVLHHWWLAVEDGSSKHRQTRLRQDARERDDGWVWEAWAKP